MKNFICSFFCIAALAACADKEVPVTTAKPEKVLASGRVCYSHGLCVDIQFMNTLPDFKTGYNYPDPTPLADGWQTQYAKPQYVTNIEDSKQDMMVSEHFWLRDYTGYRNGTKRFRNAIVMRKLVERVQQVRKRLDQPIIITSGYRSPGYNSSLSGAATFSRHMYGDAVDIVSAHASAAELKSLCDQEDAYFSLAYADGHAHCDWRHKKLDEAFFPGGIDPEVHDMDPYFITGGRIKVEDLNHEFQLSLIEFMAFEDHEGEPTYDWYIRTPNGEELRFTKNKVILKKESGQYYIRLLAGESVTFEKSVLW